MRFLPLGQVLLAGAYFRVVESTVADELLLAREHVQGDEPHAPGGDGCRSGNALIRADLIRARRTTHQRYQGKSCSVTTKSAPSGWGRHQESYGGAAASLSRPATR